MLNKKTEDTRKQVAFLCTDDLVPKHHLLRDVDRAINFSFIYDLVKDLYSEEKGRPSIDPVVLFKIVFIQYLFGIRSMRQTIKEIEVNIAYRWFLGYDLLEPIPHFTTFGKNYVRRFADSDVFERIFEKILLEAVRCKLVDPSAIFIDATRIAGSAYDANSGCVMFTTTHFSLYGIGYTAPSAKFTDIKTHWAKESIDYVVGRGLLSGTAETTFAPDTAMTRGMLVTALGRLANVDTKVYTTNSFTDVKADSAFRPYIEWAYKKGIVQGVGNSQFAPDRAISREEIAVIFANFAKATGYTLPVTRNATTYADASSIGSTYKTAVTAMQQAGIMIGGTSNKFNPKSSATRAEVSSMLHRYIKLTIDPDTAQGWTLNDAGQYLYYKNGKSLTGTQTIDSVKYFFNTDGTLKTGWVKDDAGNWRFYSGNTMLVGFWDLGANGNNKTYYFTKDGIMVAGKWLEIDGKWYYFNADGSLAKSTKVDGYEVDEDGVRKTKGN